MVKLVTEFVIQRARRFVRLSNMQLEESDGGLLAQHGILYDLRVGP